MGLKGFAVLTIAVVGIIATLTSILAVVVPLLTLKYNLAIELKETYHYNNAELALLGLVSKKHNDTYSMYRVLSEHTVNGFDENMQKSLREKLVLLVDTDCFKLVNTTATILKAESMQTGITAGTCNCADISCPPPQTCNPLNCKCQSPSEKCEPAENVGEIFLFKPYNSEILVEKIILVYS